MSGEGTRRHHDRAFKVEAVRLSFQPGRSVAGVARDLGIHENQLWRWRKQLKDEGMLGSETDPAQTEISRLRRQLAEVAEERDILKKALAVLSRRGQ